MWWSSYTTSPDVASPAGTGVSFARDIRAERGLQLDGKGVLPRCTIGVDRVALGR